MRADNRLRIWDRLVGVYGPPDREIVHSHDFNRYLTVRGGPWCWRGCGQGGSSCSALQVLPGAHVRVEELCTRSCRGARSGARFGRELANTPAEARRRAM